MEQTLTIGKITRTLAEWSRLKRISQQTLAYRIRKNWKEKDLFTPSLSPSSAGKRARSKSPWGSSRDTLYAKT